MHLLERCGILVCIMVMCGCGASSQPPVPVYPVEGTLKYQGKPVAGADVTFFNADANRSSFGRTDENGEFQLTTFSSNDGAPAGKNVVTISKFENPDAPTPVASTETEAYVPPGFNRSTDPGKPKSSFPEKYGSQQTSGLTALVNPDGPNKVDFDLK